MVLTRAKEAFDYEDFVFELKYDGFRSLAYIEDGRCELVSRNNHTYKSYRAVNEWIGKHLRVKNAILDGELVCFGPDGKPQFNTLLYRRGNPCYVAFDLLWLDGKDLRDHSLADRKAVLQAILPRSGRIHYADHLDGHGKPLRGRLRGRPGGCGGQVEMGRLPDRYRRHQLGKDQESGLFSVQRAPRTVHHFPPSDASGGSLRLTSRQRFH